MLDWLKWKAWFISVVLTLTSSAAGWWMWHGWADVVEQMRSVKRSEMWLGEVLRQEWMQIAAHRHGPGVWRSSWSWSVRWNPEVANIPVATVTTYLPPSNWKKMPLLVEFHLLIFTLLTVIHLHSPHQDLLQPSYLLFLQHQMLGLVQTIWLLLICGCFPHIRTFVIYIVLLLFVLSIIVLVAMPIYISHLNLTPQKGDAIFLDSIQSGCILLT